MSGNQITDLNLSELKDKSEHSFVIILSENGIKDLGSLRNFTNLIQIKMDNNEISDLSPLINLKGLKSIYMDSNKISDLNFFH